MDNDIYASVTALVGFDEVVSAAEGTYALFSPQRVYMLYAVKLCKIDLFAVAVRLFAYGEARGYLFIYELVELLKLNMLFLKLYSLHAAADIHSHEIGYHLVGDSHSSTDSTACACMDIGHYAYL